MKLTKTALEKIESMVCSGERITAGHVLALTDEIRRLWASEENWGRASHMVEQVLSDGARVHDALTAEVRRLGGNPDAITAEHGVHPAGAR